MESERLNQEEVKLIELYELYEKRGIATVINNGRID